MRKILLFLMVLGFAVGTQAQQRAVASKTLRDKAVKNDKKAVKFTNNPNGEYTPGTKASTIFDEVQIGQTRYDLQTNASVQNRVFLYDDGTIGATWNLGMDEATFGTERGTGYNYYDGNSWGPEPTERIEDEWTGWPSYGPYGENGELVVNHTYVDGLWVGTRSEKGTGDWSYNYLPGPPGAVDISWPRAITSGTDNSIIHALYATYVAYNGQDAAIGYSRSTDGGVTWDPENLFMEELGPDHYTTMAGDIYDWANPNAGTIAFLVGEAWTDLILMKSTDDGNTWDQTIIWECPYPLNSGLATDTFYCADGSHHLAIDNSGKVHVVFGINRAHSDGSTQYWFPFVDGVGYWNEDMPTFSNDLNALSPYGDPGTELVEDYNLIAWSQDINGNGELDLLEEVGTYYLGLSSMVQLIVDDLNQIFLIYSSVTEGFDNGNQSFRHLWARSSPDGGNTWGPFYHLNDDLIYIFDECVFPSVSPTSDDENIYFLYQADSEPGLAVRGDEDPYTDNFMRFVSLNKEDIIDGIQEEQLMIDNSSVSQNFPNPATKETTFYVNLSQPASLSVEIVNTVGQTIYSIPTRNYSNGNVKFNINVEDYEPGIYFYKVRSGKTSVTKKMIIQ